VLKNLLDKYLVYLCDVRGLSPHTIASYRRDLVRWVTFLDEQHQQLTGSPRNDPLFLRLFLRERTESGLSNRSLARFLSALSGFQKYLMDQHKATEHIFKLPAIKFGQRLPEFLTQADSKRIFDHEGSHQKKDTYRYWRDYTLSVLIYVTGIRRAEVAGLDLTDLDLRSGMIRVLGKGNKERIVPFGDNTRKDIDLYLEQRSDFGSLHNSESPALFLNRDGRRLSVRSIDRVVGQFARKVGVKCTPHTLRHSFATHLLENGADLLLIKEILGHASLSTTQNYTHVTAEKMKKTYANAHPRSGRRN